MSKKRKDSLDRFNRLNIESDVDYLIRLISMLRDDKDAGKFLVKTFTESIDKGRPMEPEKELQDNEKNEDE